MEKKKEQWRNRLAGLAVGVATIVIIGAVIAGVSHLAGWHPVQALVRGAQSSAHFWWVVTKLFAVPMVLSIVVMGMNPRSDNQRGLRIRRSLIVVAVLWPLVMFWPTIRPELRRPHDVRHAAVNSVLTVKDAKAPGYEPRVPYTLAERRLARALGNERGVSLSGIWTFEIEGVQNACGVMLPSSARWKRPASGVACLNLENNVVTKARFEAQLPSPYVTIGELRLIDAIAERVPYANYRASDVYGYIKDGEPFMVVPLRVRAGGATFHDAWGGALVFDTNGEITHVKEVTDQVPGPIVGESLADDVLNAINDRGGYVERNQNRNTYDMASPAEALARIPSDWETNVRHHLLERSDGSGYRLVTMLTPKKVSTVGVGTNGAEREQARRRASDAVVAVLEIDPRDVEYKGWPQTILYELPEPPNQPSRVSIAEAQDMIRSRYGSTLQLANSQLSFVEPTLVAADVIRVTIAGQQEVAAYAEVNISDRTSCLYRANGEELRCDESASSALGPDVTAPETGTDGDVVPNDPALSGLSDQEILDRIEELLAELRRRR